MIAINHSKISWISKNQWIGVDIDDIGGSDINVNVRSFSFWAAQIIYIVWTADLCHSASLLY